MTLRYTDYARVRCPRCQRRVAGVPDGEGVRLVRHRTGEPRDTPICEASERRIVRDLNAWKLERRR